MTRIRRFHVGTRLDVYQPVLNRVLLHACAVGVLIVVLWLNSLLWPIPFLGVTYDLTTAQITAIEPGSAADVAGLRVGDRLLRLYHLPIDAVQAYWNLLPLIGPRTQPIPFMVERDTGVATILVRQGTPSLTFQLMKATALVLALLCWCTGYVLGIVRRYEAARTTATAVFWLAMSGVIGAYVFAVYLSLPLAVVLQWCIITILLPFAIYTHVNFFVHTRRPQTTRLACNMLLGSWCVLNASLCIAVGMWQLSLSEVMILLSTALPIAVCIAVVSSGGLLVHTYLHAVTAHSRRQIRLIASACVAVAFFQAAVYMLPSITDNPMGLFGRLLDATIGLIPLAYLVGGITDDLYRVDRLATRLSMHFLTILLIGGGLSAFLALAHLRRSPTALWLVLCFLVLYRPLYMLELRLIAARTVPAYRYRALAEAETQLTTTLDAPTLIQILVAGVRNTFRHPPVAFYHAQRDGSDALMLLAHERFRHMPPHVAAGALTKAVRTKQGITESRVLATTLAQQVLQSDEEQLLYHPGVVLWCPVQHAQGTLLGVLLVGIPGDFDPYRSADIRELQRLIDAAALAFTNSVAYMQQCEAEATIRQLYHHLQEVQDVTAAAIARELHDEVLNVNVRLNIESLRHMIASLHNSPLRTELTLILESEYAVVDAVRMLCERLHPTGIDDSLGLVGVLRQQVARVQSMWSGACHLSVMQTPLPIDPRVQREAVRIAREALTNAVKHAQGTRINVEVQYPCTATGLVELRIRDDGQSYHPVAPKSGHWGVRNMYESAQIAGGTLDIRREHAGGTVVVFTFAPMSHEPKGALAVSIPR